MMIAPALLYLTVAAVLVDCRPQDNFSFPGSATRPSRFPQQPPGSFNPRVPPTGFRPQMTSQAFIPGNQPFPTQSQVMPARTTPASQLLNELDSATSASTTSDGTTTRIPPRDPGNRIVYILPPNCDCPFTTQYTPVCGTDGQTYGNIGILTCNRMCGTNVDVYLMGACGRNNG